MGYQRFLSPVFKPFNPLELVREIGEIVTRKGFGRTGKGTCRSVQFLFTGGL